MILLSDYNTETKLCICKCEQDLAHIYECKVLNDSYISVNYNRIYNGTLKEQEIILNRMKINLKKKEDIENNFHSP